MKIVMMAAMTSGMLFLEEIPHLIGDGTVHSSCPRVTQATKRFLNRCYLSLLVADGTFQSSCPPVAQATKRSLNSTVTHSEERSFAKYWSSVWEEKMCWRMRMKHERYRKEEREHLLLNGPSST